MNVRGYKTISLRPYKSTNDTVNHGSMIFYNIEVTLNTEIGNIYMRQYDLSKTDLR